MKPRIIITLVQGHLIAVADGDVDTWIETAHDTHQVKPKVVTREQFDALLAGKIQVGL